MTLVTPPVEGKLFAKVKAPPFVNSNKFKLQCEMVQVKSEKCLNNTLLITRTLLWLKTLKFYYNLPHREFWRSFFSMEVL